MQRIPDTDEIPHLRDSIVKLLQDFQVQVKVEFVFSSYHNSTEIHVPVAKYDTCAVHFAEYAGKPQGRLQKDSCEG